MFHVFWDDIVLGFKEWLFVWLYYPVWTFSPELSPQQGISTHRAVAHLMFFPTLWLNTCCITGFFFLVNNCYFKGYSEVLVSQWGRGFLLSYYVFGITVAMVTYGYDTGINVGSKWSLLKQLHSNHPKWDLRPDLMVKLKLHDFCTIQADSVITGMCRYEAVGI